MQLVDTHCHLDFPDYKDTLDEVLKRAEAHNVVRIVVPGTDLESSRKAIALAEKYPTIFAAIGVHPHEADKVEIHQVAADLRRMAIENEKIVAIGEIGLDYYRKYSGVEKQKELFRACLALACELDLPVILHNRNAGNEVLDILKEVGEANIKGVVHCFSGSEEFLDRVLKMGLYVSFAGNITYEKNSDLRELARSAGLEKLLLETDSPYLAPEKLRGKTNEPKNVQAIVDIYQEIFGKSKEEISEVTTHNANRLFRLGLEKQGSIVYAIRNSLYINVTHRCTNRCSFCTRNASDYVKGYNLRLDKEPETDEVIASLGNLSKYEEVAFCGLGEPTLRLGLVKEVACFIKKANVRTRLITNGEGNLIAARPIASELKGIIDKVSVSINAANSTHYQGICHSIFDKDAYTSILDFVKECKLEGIEVEVTCLDFIGENDVSMVKQFAEKAGASFRLRHLNVVG